MKGGNGATNGAKPRGQKDMFLPPKKLFSEIPTSNQEPTLSGVVTLSSIGEPA